MKKGIFRRKKRDNLIRYSRPLPALHEDIDGNMQWTMANEIRYEYLDGQIQGIKFGDGDSMSIRITQNSDTWKGDSVGTLLVIARAPAGERILECGNYYLEGNGANQLTIQKFSPNHNWQVDDLGETIEFFKDAPNDDEYRHVFVVKYYQALLDLEDSTEYETMLDANKTINNSWANTAEVISSVLMFRTTKEAEFYMQFNEPASPEEVLNSWPRGENTTYYPDPTIIDPSQTASEWYYDGTQDSFVQPINSGPTQVLLSPLKTDSYEFEATLTSPSGDDDAIGLVVSSGVINGEVRSVIVWVANGGLYTRKTFFITDPDENVVVENDYFPNHRNADGGDGWSGKERRVKITRNGSMITAVSTDWDNTSLYDSNTEMSFDLSTLPSAYSALQGKSRYGFATKSQPNSTYLDYSIRSADVGDETSIYSQEENRKWEYTGGAWVEVGAAAPDFIGVDTIRNYKTKEEFGIAYSTLSFNVNDGISYGEADVFIRPNQTDTIPMGEITSQFSYTEPMEVTRTFEETNMTLSSIDPSGVTFNTTDMDGSFYALLETPMVTDPSTGSTNNTIAFRKINAIINVILEAAYVFRKDVEAEKFTTANTPVSASDILAGWPRAQNTTYWSDPSLVDQSPADQWFVDGATNSIVQPVNTTEYQHIVSPDKSDNFVFEAILTADTPDGDSIGLVAAADYIGGEFLSLVALVHTGGQKQLPTLALGFFDSTIVGGSHTLEPTVVAGNDFLPQDPINTTVSNTDPNYGWWNREVKMKITRVNSIITVVVSDWNGTDYEQASTITYDINDLPRNGSSLSGPARHGFFSNSTANSTYLNYSIRSDSTANGNVVYSIETGTLWEYDGATWNTSVADYPNIGSIDVLTNPYTKETYNSTGTAITFEVNNGIPDGDITFNTSPSTTATLSQTGIDFVEVYDAVDCTATVVGTDVEVVSTAVAGSFLALVYSSSLDAYAYRTVQVVV